MSEKKYPPAPPCQCPDHEAKPRRLLTPLLLDCWIREHGIRPFNSLTIHGKIFKRKYYRPFENDDFRTLQQYLMSPKQAHLTQFEFLYMPLTDTWAERIVVGLSKMTAISLCGVDLPAQALATMVAFAANSPLELLRLSGNSFTEEHSNLMRKFLLKNKTLKYLDVGYCHLDEIKFPMVADGIVNCNTIKSIDMSQIVPIQHKATVESHKVALLAAILISRNRLCELRMRHCNLTCHDMTPIAEYMSGIGEASLTFLDVGSNRIGPHGVDILFAAIIGSKYMIGLNLCCNQIRSEGAETIAHKLPFTRIKYLDIAYNRISAPMMGFILQTIKKTHAMRVLNITGNKFARDEGTTFDRHTEVNLPYIATCDCTVTYDEDELAFRVIPSFSEHASKFNERYHRVASYIYRYNVLPYYSSCTKCDGRLPLINCVHIDPVVVR